MVAEWCLSSHGVGRFDYGCSEFVGLGGGCGCCAASCFADLLLVMVPHCAHQAVIMSSQVTIFLPKDAGIIPRVLR